MNQMGKGSGDECADFVLEKAGEFRPFDSDRQCVMGVETAKLRVQ